MFDIYDMITLSLVQPFASYMYIPHTSEDYNYMIVFVIFVYFVEDCSL